MSTNNRQAMPPKLSDNPHLRTAVLMHSVACVIRMSVDGSISFRKWEADLSETLAHINVETAGLYLESVLLANWMLNNQKVFDSNEQFDQICSKADVITLSGNMGASDVKKLYKTFIELGLRDLVKTTAEVQYIVKLVRPEITQDQVLALFVAGSPTTKSVEVAKLAYDTARKHADALLSAARTRYDIASERMEMTLSQASSPEATTLEYDAVVEAKRDFDEAAAAVDAIINGPAFAAVRDAHKAHMDAIKKP